MKISINDWNDYLIQYAVEKELIDERDINWARNHVLDVLRLQDYKAGGQTNTECTLDEILNGLSDFACEKKLIEDTAGNRALFETKLMGIVTPLPSVVADAFYHRKENGVESATDYFFSLCSKVNYIKDDSNNIGWKTATEYGHIDITINLTKPEKDPKDIAVARDIVQSGYPRCLLCTENEGYAGRADHPARQNLRIVPIEICGGL